MSKAPVRVQALTKDVVEVLNEAKWQTASIIVAQICLPPQAVARRSMNDGEYKKRGHTLVAARTSLACQVLYKLHKNGSVERRRNAEGRWEYRKLPK